MFVVIQCAASKSGAYLRAADGREVFFVAQPEKAPENDRYVYAHPDDPSGDGLTWREKLLRYNEKGENPQKLARAFELYDNAVYRSLVDVLGIEKVFILSAGWGLIRAEFLTPYYDITFNRGVARKGEDYKLRGPGRMWRDFRHLPSASGEPLVFLGGKDYVPLFSELTRTSNLRRHIFYNAAQPPTAQDCILERYNSPTRTNWHYECAKALLDGRITAGGHVPQQTADAIFSRDIQPQTGAFPRRRAPSGATGFPTSANFQDALDALLEEAMQAGKAHVDVVAGELHRRVGGYPGPDHRMPMCCAAMRRCLSDGDTILHSPPSGRGASLAIRYRIPRAG